MKFYPFDVAVNGVSSDFDLNAVGKMLGLSAVQTALLGHFLRRIEILVWYTDETEPHIELCVFTDLSIVASVDLRKLTADLVVSNNDIGAEEETVALEALRAQIDGAIKARRAEPHTIDGTGKAIR